jgi:hypothetical protein
LTSTWVPSGLTATPAVVLPTVMNLARVLVAVLMARTIVSAVLVM